MEKQAFLEQSQQIKLINLAKLGNLEARNNLMKNYTNYIEKKANRYFNKLKDTQIEKDDLIQEGFLAILNAIKKYDETKGSFSTYVTYWIDAKMIRYIEKNRLLFIIPHVYYYKMVMIEKVSNNLAMKLGYYPSLSEIALELKWPLEKLIRTINYQKEIFYLEENIKNDLKLGDFIASDSLSAEDEALNNLFKFSDIKSILLEIITNNKQMTDKEKDFIKTMYFSNDQVLSLIKTTEKLGNVKVGQTPWRALSKLRTSKDILKLIELYQFLYNSDEEYVISLLNKQITNDQIKQKKLNNERINRYQKRKELN